MLLLSVFAFAANAQTLEIEVLANKTDVFTCEELKYTLKYKCASTTTNCTNVTMSASAPSGVIFPTQVVGLTSDIASYTFSVDRRSVTFQFKEPLIAGNTGIIELIGQGECGLAEGTIATLTGTIQSGTGTPITASVNTTLHSSDKFCPKKSQGSGLALDYPTTYSITLQPAGVYGSAGIGTTSLTNVVMVDNLPANTVINSVSSKYSQGGSYIALPSGTCIIDNTAAAPKITCTFPDNAFKQMNNIGSGVIVDVSVTYPDASFNVADNVTNSVTVNYTPLGGTPKTAVEGSIVNYVSGNTYATRGTASCTADLDVTDVLAAPKAEADLTKTSNFYTIRPGEAISYQLSLYNTGNIPLNNVGFEDVIPTDLRVSKISLPTAFYGFTTNPPVTIWIKTTANPVYTAVTFSGNSYDVPSGTEITHIKMTVPNMPANSSVLYMIFEVRLKDGVTSGTIQNCATLFADESPTDKNINNNCHTITAQPLDTFSTLQISKTLGSFPGGSSASFYSVAQSVGTTVWCNFEVMNLGGGQPLQNPIVADLLPKGLTYDNQVQYSGACMPAADVIEVIDNFQGSGRTLVRLKWNTDWPSGCYMIINIRTKLNNLAVAGSIAGTTDPYWLSLYPKPFEETAYAAKNSVFFTGSSVAKCKLQNSSNPIGYYATQDLLDIDSDGSTTSDSVCFSSAFVNVNSQAQLSSVKWVKGQCDSVYTKYPNYGKTTPGGLANYRLIISNTGNVPATSIEILDMLPYIGDIGVIDPQARLTQWRPNLVTPLNTPTGVTVYYTTVQNPCRTGYIAAGPSGCNPPNWTTIVPTDPTTVQGLKFDFGSKILNPGDIVELTWDMRAPVNPPMTGDTIAWNSFGYKAIRADNNDPFLAAEPNKVGIQLKPIVPGAYGNRVWIDANKNGIQDAGELGIDGVRVELHKDNGDGVADPKNDELVNYTSTANGGLYLFPNLSLGDYFAVFFIPPGYSSTIPNVSTPADSLDSDGDATLCNGQRVTVTEITNIEANEIDLRWDQGVFVDKAALGDYVWFDQNENNIQDESTTNGVNGVIVCLYKDTNSNGISEPDAADGIPIAIDTTSNDIYGRPGYYLFENLDAGSYFVKFKLATGQTFTPNTGTQNGTSDPSDSDPNASGVTPVTQLTAGEVDLTWDAGIIIPTGPYNLGNLVWSDVNNNGIVDGSEVGINGVSVLLYVDRNNNDLPDPDEYLTATVTATVGGIAGTYTFTNLPAENYIVVIPNSNFTSALTGYISSTGNDPAPDPDDNVENDDNGTLVAPYGVISKPITLGSNAEPLDGGVTNYTVDFGFYLCQKPTATVTVTQPSCAGTNSPDNGVITITGFTTGQKYQYSTGTTFTSGSAIPATITVIPANGIISSTIPNTNGSYTIRIYDATDNSCYVDRVISIVETICCTTPTATVSATQPSCSGTNAPNNGGITIAGFTTGQRYQYSAGTTFNSGAATPASITVIPVGGNITSTLSNTTGSYTVRIYDATDNACYVDKTVTITAVVCCVIPTSNAPTSTAGTCTGSNLNNDATISVTGITGDKAAISSAGAATFNGALYASATAVSGGSITFSNLQHGANYIIRIYNLAETCYKDITFTTATRTCCPSPNCGTVTVQKN